MFRSLVFLPQCSMLSEERRGRCTSPFSLIEEFDIEELELHI